MTQVEIVGGNKEEGKNLSSHFAFFSQAKTETSTRTSFNARPKFFCPLQVVRGDNLKKIDG